MLGVAALNFSYFTQSWGGKPWLSGISVVEPIWSQNSYSVTNSFFVSNGEKKFEFWNLHWNNHSLVPNNSYLTVYTLIISNNIILLLFNTPLDQLAFWYLWELNSRRKNAFCFLTALPHGVWDWALPFHQLQVPHVLWGSSSAAFSIERQIPVLDSRASVWNDKGAAGANDT